ncbi:MAG: helix-turn-helix domain-containing protein [Paenibacillaceae bacterium]|nr:helix-turn-helix domain-containing protein [Paenibacillaceae bacterium]
MRQFPPANRRIYRRIIVSVTLLVVSVILTLSFVLYVNFEKIGVRLVTDAKLSTLSQISYSADYMNDSVKSFAASIFLDQANLPLMYGASENFDSVVAQMKTITTIANSSPYINSVYVYNGALQRFYSTRGMTMSDERDFADRDLVNLIHSGALTADKHFRPFLRKLPMNAYTPDSNYTFNAFTYFLYDFFDDNQKIKGAIIINVKVDYLAQMVSALSAKTSVAPNDTYIMNEEGKLFTQTNASYDWSDPTEETFLRQAIAAQTNAGYYVSDRDGDKVLVTYAVSDETNWRFVNVTPYRDVISDIERMKRQTVWVCAIILAAGFLLASIMASYLYAPIRVFTRRIAKLAGVNEHETGPDELRFLTGVFEGSVEKAQAGEALKRENQAIQRQEALRALLSDATVTAEQMARVFAKYDIPLSPELPHILFVVQIDDAASFSQRFSASDQQLLRFAIGNVACEAAMKVLQQQAVVMNEQEIVVVVQPSGPADKQFGKLTEALRQVQSWSANHLQLSLSAAMSYVSGSLTELAQSYQEALNVSRYRLLYGHGSILSPEALSTVEHDGFVPPQSLEQQLDDQLTLGKSEEAIDTYRRIIAYVSGYSYDVITTYTLHLAYVVYRKANELGLADSHGTTLDYARFTQLIFAAETLEQMNGPFIELITRIGESASQTKYVRKHALAEKVAGIVMANYADKTLCQESIAGTINISKDYLGKLFREAYGKSIAEHISETRLNKAAAMLASEDGSLTDLLERIGWENKNYFYTQFKAKFGVTTSEYRAMHKGAAPSKNQ